MLQATHCKVYGLTCIHKCKIASENAMFASDNQDKKIKKIIITKPPDIACQN